MNNPERALQLLGLPIEFLPYDGPIEAITRHTLVENVLVDYTVLDANRKPTKTTTYSVASTKQAFGHYAFNLLNSFLHWNNFELLNATNLHKNHKVATVDVGPFAGHEYWYPWQHVTIQSAAQGHDIVLTSEPWMNTTSKGLPEPTKGENPSLNQSVLRITTIRTKTKTGTKDSQVKNYVNYTKSQIMALTGWSELQIAEAYSQVFHVFERDSVQHIQSVAAEIVHGETTIHMTYNVNGMEVGDSFNPSGMITSYGKQWPGVVKEWRLFNDIVNNTSLGTTWNSRDNNTISVEADTAFSFDDVANVLKYNSEAESQMLVAHIEENPAQGKNFAVQVYYQLDTGVEIPA